MGKMMLKIKRELDYRPGTKGMTCADCKWFVPEHPCKGIGGVDLGPQPRCIRIGLEPGRSYRISPKYVCNKWNVV